MTSKTIKCQIWSRSTKGGRPDHENEDSLGLLLPGLPSKETIENLDGGNVFALGKDGVVMVVADGMGGLNAGEVASHIAVDVVKQAFEKKTAEIDSLSRSDERRRIFLEGIIRESDRAIREHSAKHDECANMGSTIVIAWLVGQILTVSWCGDSRAYILHGGQLEMITHDHSYVQDLVDKGELDYEASFIHPDNNIVTHCLGATDESSVKADSRTIDVEKDDIILLCSDGVSGVLFDDARFYKGKPLSSENLQDTLVRNGADAKAAVNGLLDAAKRCGWHDNATAIVCRIVDGPLLPRIACRWLRRYWWVLIASMTLSIGFVGAMQYFKEQKEKNHLVHLGILKPLYVKWDFVVIPHDPECLGESSESKSDND